MVRNAFRSGGGAGGWSAARRGRSSRSWFGIRIPGFTSRLSSAISFSAGLGLLGSLPGESQGIEAAGPVVECPGQTTLPDRETS